jgi:pantoate--beta-alanine ligase
MKILRSAPELQAELSGPKGTVGFVPTMGALHEGHLSLVRRSREENTVTVVSIFVNPTQFNDKKDFENYPITFSDDCAMLEKAGVDFLFYPSYEELYADNYRYRISESDLSHVLCGAHRPGHFDGVLTVVMKLLNLVNADRAYFGEKDFQQMELVAGMAKAFFMKTKILGCPTVRESDGLAMSSRNRRLSPNERTRAANFPAILSRPGLSLSERRELLAREGFDVDYVEERANRRFGAVRLGDVRLIDNVEVSS